MSSNTISSLVLPAVISCMGLVITQTWYMKMSKVSPTSGASGPVLAVLNTKTDLIERRPAARIIWEDLGKGEPLFSGEAVRTSSKATGDITFLKSGMTIKLEPDSLVIIEEADGKLQLNLVNGGVFVKSEDKPASGVKKVVADQPVLKAGNQKIVLGGEKSSEMNLSVSEGGSANIQVSKGDVKVAAEGGKVEVVAEGKSKSVAITASGPVILDVQGPRSGATIPITGTSDVMKLTWTNAPTGASVFFESGGNRDSLKRQSVGFPAELKKMSGPVTAGEFFWRLVAVKDAKIVAIGATYFNYGLVLEAPKLLANGAGEKINMKEGMDSPEVRLAWTRPQGSDSIAVTLSKDAEFKNILSNNIFPTESEWSASIKSAGKYYWRAVAKWPGIDRQISSRVGSFNVTLQREYPAPELMSPVDGAEVTKIYVESAGLILAWSKREEADSYTVNIEQSAENTFKPFLTKNSTSEQIRLETLDVGIYRWSIQANIGVEKSKFSGVHILKIIDMPRLSLKNPNIFAVPLVFESATSPILIPLSDAPKNAAEFRFRVGESTLDLKTLPWQVSPLTAPLKFNLPAAGQFNLMAEAIDKSGKVVAISSNFRFEMKAPDQLAAPVLSTGIKPLTASEDGDIALSWAPVPGAARYIVVIVGRKMPLRSEVTTTTFKISGLHPGDHTLVVTAVDKAGRQGIAGPVINLVVPDVSGIVAPKSKGIKIR